MLTKRAVAERMPRAHPTRSAFILLAVMAAVLAATHDSPREAITFRGLAWNTHLLPRIGERFAGKRSRSDYRATGIGSAVAEYDLVGLCEVFDTAYRQSLIDAAQSQSHDAFQVLWTPKPAGRGWTGSGLLLLSRFPIESHHALTYTHASQFAAHGFRADSFAAKGALHARLRLSERPVISIDCFLTHLESRSDAARSQQLEELAQFIGEHADQNRPALLLGDLNVPGDDQVDAKDTSSPYGKLLSILSQTGTKWIDAWSVAGHGHGGTSEPLDEKGGRRIDYVFVSAARDQRIRVLDAEVLRFLDQEVPEGSLSDHSGVAFRMTIPR